MAGDQSTQHAAPGRGQEDGPSRSARHGGWEWDIAANTVAWSDQLFRIFGLEPGSVEPTYEGFLERFHADDRDGVDERNRRAFADHKPFDDVNRAVREDGTVIVIHTSGQVVLDDEGIPLRMVGVCEDVTADREADRALAELASIVESSEDAVIASTPTGMVTSWNPGATRLYGYSREEMLGREMKALAPFEQIDAEEARRDRLLAGGDVESYETRRRRKDGSLVDVSVSLSPVLDGDGSIVAVSTIDRDITERKRFEQRLRRLAERDHLTGLPNRRVFEEELELRVLDAKSRGSVGAVLMLDLDNFKYVNDAFGHAAGDDLLRSVARALKARIRRDDVLARFGGDEFAILVPSADQAAASVVGAAVLGALRDHVVPIEGRAITLTASIGIACYDAGVAVEDGGEVLASADRAMYVAKEGGRDRIATAARSKKPVETRLGWEHRIREALEQDLFVLHYQPILDLRTNRISRYEALLRMTDGDRLTPPAAFLEVAERHGLIHAIDRWVVGEAIRMLSVNPDLTLEVNLSGRSLDDPQILDLIRSGLRASQVDPGRLCFEITETAAVGNMDIARRMAMALQRLGCTFALDDFGAGFGSFHYLKRIPAEFLKIDGDFVRPPRSRVDQLIIEAIVRIAGGLGKRTIAEWVEDAATLEFVREAGVDFAQGYEIGRPEPPEDIQGLTSGR
jgi:diguanylate cyclase (GGDEF)-like protein/PAS domain S-box-containing protein